MRIELAHLREENLEMRMAMKLGADEDWEDFKTNRRVSTVVSKNKFIGVDLGGTTVSVGLMRDDGSMLAKDQENLKDRTFDTVVAQIIELCKGVVRKAGINMRKVTCIGVGSPGNLNRDEGLVINAANFQLWKNEPICERIAQGTGCCNVVLENDANAALMAEWWVGAAKGCSSVAMVTLGTGVGGGLILGM
jgi:glucokinase